VAELALGQLAEATAMARLSLSGFRQTATNPKLLDGLRRADARQLTLAHAAMTEGNGLWLRADDLYFWR
jgi:hypothetical protein